MVRLPGDNSEPGKVRSALFALLIHIIFLALLVFGLNWKNEAPEAMSVDLWADLPRHSAKPLPPVEKATPKPEPVKTQPQQRAQQKPQPQPVIKAAPPPARKPEIAFKDKAEKPQPKEEVKKSEPVKKEVLKEEPVKKPVEKPVLPKEEAKKPEPKIEPKPEPIKKEVPKTAPVKKVEQKTENKDDARQKAEAQKQAQQRVSEAAAAQAKANGEIDKYKAMIQAKIRSRIIMPPDLPGDPVVEFTVTLLPGGDVLAVALRKSSGYTAFDEAVERAIYLAKPLPLPPDPGLFNAFRSLDLKVYYRE